MNEIEHAESLLGMAKKDLNALRGMTDSTLFADEIFGFHVQQAIEKSLKAWIAALGNEYPFHHNIAELLAALEKSGQDCKSYWDLVEYNAFAVGLRYEALDLEASPLNRESAAEKAHKLFNHVQHFIESQKSA